MLSQIVCLIRHIIVNATFCMNLEFDTVYKENYLRLFRVASKMLHDADAAKDVVQDVFESYYMNSIVKYQIHNINSWLLRATINKSIDLYQKKKKFSGMDYIVESEDNSHPEQDIDAALLQKAIDKLDTRDKTIIILYSEGYPYKEIAHIADIKFTSVGKLLARALDKLKILMKDKI